MNFVGIDPSLISTSVVVNGKHLFNYTTEKTATNKSGLNKWYSLCEELVKYRWIKYDNKEDFTDSEVEKLDKYDYLSDMIIEDIIDSIDETKPIHIGIEGYSYSSAAGPLIDLVTYGTLLRRKLLDVTGNIKIFPPMTLKLESAKLTYPMVLEKKKEVWRNKEGVAGGKFNKFDMYKALTENESFNSEWVNFLREIQDDVFQNKSIKKPMEDCNDAYLIYEVLKNSNRQ